MVAGTRRSSYERYFSGWNSHDLPQVMAQLTDEGTYFDPVTTELLGRAEIQHYFEGIMQGFPDIHFEDRIIETQKNRVFVSEWRAFGTHTGSYLGIPPTGNSLMVDGVSVFTITDQGITDIKAYFDQKAINDQLGMSFPKIVGQVPKLAYRALNGYFQERVASSD